MPGDKSNKERNQKWRKKIDSDITSHHHHHHQKSKKLFANLTFNLFQHRTISFPFWLLFLLLYFFRSRFIVCYDLDMIIGFDRDGRQTFIISASNYNDERWWCLKRKNLPLFLYPSKYESSNFHLSICHCTYRVFRSFRKDDRKLFRFFFSELKLQNEIKWCCLVFLLDLDCNNHQMVTIFFCIFSIW